MTGTSIFYCPDRTEFCLPFIFNGAKCKIVEACENTIRVLFGEEKESCLVTSEYLISLAEWKRIQRKVKKSKE